MDNYGEALNEVDDGALEEPVPTLVPASRLLSSPSIEKKGSVSQNKTPKNRSSAKGDNGSKNNAEAAEKSPKGDGKKVSVI